MTTVACVFAPRLIVNAPAIGQCSMRTESRGLAGMPRHYDGKRADDSRSWARVRSRPTNWPHCRLGGGCATSRAIIAGARRMSRFRTPLLAVMAVLIATPSFAQQGTDTSAVYLYKGADRDQRLLAAAKKEGTLTFYTSMQTPESGPLSAAFEKKYGIKINLWRATSDQVVQRAVAEARGGRNTMVVVE